MSSLLPAPLGCGTRKNLAKRQYVLANISRIQYRCVACKSGTDAKALEYELRTKNKYRFQT
jgi:hypothetical protein